MRRRILISGASSGLGAEMARQFAAKGRDLALCARRTDRLEHLRDEIRRTHPQVRIAIRAIDVTDDTAVFTGFDELAGELGGLDRVIVNAGLGKGARLGTGRFDVNRETALTNVIGTLAQAEAALTRFREADAGHLVLVSSVSALRGMRGAMTTYAASKAAVSSLGEGLRVDLAGTPIAVTTVLPGYIASEMNDRVAHRTPLMTGTTAGVRAMVRAIEREAATAVVPPWPWVPLAAVLRVAPIPLLRRMI